MTSHMVNSFGTSSVARSGCRREDVACRYMGGSRVDQPLVEIASSHTRHDCLLHSRTSIVSEDWRILVEVAFIARFGQSVLLRLWQKNVSQTLAPDLWPGGMAAAGHFLF